LETGVAFSTEFLELNYWQAIVMLYRQSLSVPAMFEGEYNTSTEVDSPSAFTAELLEDEDRIYCKVAEAGQKILRIYRQLHLSGLVSYTYLSTHHLFMAGISYLYAIWHSPIVRSQLTLDEVDLTILAAKSVFTDMIDKCPPAETCRDAFDRTAKATIKMASQNGGFGAQSQSRRRPKQRRDQGKWTPADAAGIQFTHQSQHRQGEQGHQQNHHQQQQHQQYSYDVSMADDLSSPTRSVNTDLTSVLTPPLSRAQAADGYFGTQQRAHRIPNSDPGSSSMDPSIGTSPPLTRRIPAAPVHNAGANNAYAGQHQPQYDLQRGIDFPDAHSMDFLQGLGTNTPNGGDGGGDEFSGFDQAQLNLGFGINWEGLSNEYGEVQQQMNPFDSFFFGGQQGGAGGGMGL
jgi:hypothetical protein